MITRAMLPLKAFPHQTKGVSALGLVRVCERLFPRVQRRYGTRPFELARRHCQHIDYASLGCQIDSSLQIDAVVGNLLGY
jgi:hypothetical protein